MINSLPIDVSVLIATYNRKSLICRAINSALSQEGVSLEIIVVDDCSTDNTYNFISNAYDSSIILLQTESNSGRALASNIGFSASKGNYIALLDDDDYWLDPFKLKKQLDLFKSNEKLGIVSSWWYEEYNDGTRIKKTPLAPSNRYKLINRILSGGGLISGSSPLISRLAWLHVGGMDINHPKGIDSDLYRRIIISDYGIYIISEFLVVADVDHPFGRMTPIANTSSISNDLISNLRTLRKFFLIYLIFPFALLLRLRRILRLFTYLLNSLVRYKNL